MMDRSTEQVIIPTLDARITVRLRAVAARLRVCVLIVGIARLLVFLLAAFIVQFLLDYGTRGLRVSIRATLLALIVAATLWLAWRVIIRPLRIHVGLAEVARLVERRYPQLASALISAVRFSAREVGGPEANSPSLMAEAIARAGRSASGLDLKAVIDVRPARRSGAVVVGVLALVSAMALAWPDLMGLWFARNLLLQDVAWLRKTHLRVDLPGDELVGARGDDLVIEATAEGVQPRIVEMFYKTSSGVRGRETMATIGSAGRYRYRHTMKNAQEDFTFFLEGGDDRTREFNARLLERPRVAATGMSIKPPAYTRLETVTLGDGQRAARVLPGSHVTMTIELNKPVVQATLMSSSERLQPAHPVDVSAAASREFSISILPTVTRTYHFSLLDEVGLENRRPLRFSLRVTEDEPPRSRIKLPGVGDMITPEAILPIEVEFADTYGLASAEVAYEVTRDGESVEGVTELKDFRPGSVTFATSLSWVAAGVAIQPGDQLTLVARARDYDDVSGPNEGRSSEMQLRVVTRDELLAELARREQEFRMDFERLVDAQDQLRGSLLSVMQQSSDQSLEEHVALLAPLERRQRNIAGSVNVIRQQFEHVLSEMRVNQLSSLEVEERLADGIVNPLIELTRRDLASATDAVRRWSRDASPEVGSLVDPLQATILKQMREVLARMIQWEGYQEAVTMLRDILRLQRELEEETRRATEERAGDLFDD